MYFLIHGFSSPMSFVSQWMNLCDTRTFKTYSLFSMSLSTVVDSLFYFITIEWKHTFFGLESVEEQHMEWLVFADPSDFVLFVLFLMIHVLNQNSPLETGGWSEGMGRPELAKMGKTTVTLEVMLMKHCPRMLHLIVISPDNYCLCCVLLFKLIAV